MSETNRKELKEFKQLKTLEDSKAPMWIALVLILAMIGGGIYNIIYNIQTW